MSNILLIDDDELVRKSVERLLIKAEYSVVCADGVDQALDAIREQEFDLIVSDMRMPGKNGVEVVREIKKIVNHKNPRDIPIIFITGYAESVVELKAEIYGEVILKPFDLEHLLITIREYL